jgi:ATP-independent RNA helicase DbpA
MDEMGRVGRIEQFTGQPSQWQGVDTLTPAPGRPCAPMTTLQIVGGRKEKIRPGDVLGALTGEPASRASRWARSGDGVRTYVAVARDIGEAALARLNAGRIKGKKVNVRPVEGVAGATAAKVNGPRRGLPTAVSAHTAPPAPRAG